ncbi:MAG: type II toxin-antitoxin system RelE/ParE family toxin [Saprospiraceae bacterium]|nr:type II toxin-antitoxin system RelE/ParE family toxin [Saprospiraceae bacterium]
MKSGLLRFAFFEGNKLVITINGFQKKTQKTPKSEIDKAKKIRIEYESEK